MASCPKCGAEVAAHTVACATCGAGVAIHHQGLLSSIYAHVPHPHIAHRKKNPPKPASGESGVSGPITRFNTYIGVKITDAVGTMWCAYLFAALALVSLPEAIKGGTAMLIAWIAQTFIQLVLLSIIMVGQRVAAAASDKQAAQTYNDAEALLQISDRLHQLVTINNRLTEEIHESLTRK